MLSCVNRYQFAWHLVYLYRVEHNPDRSYRLVFGYLNRNYIGALNDRRTHRTLV
jgi:hypothetical protein